MPRYACTGLVFAFSAFVFSGSSSAAVIGFESGLTGPFIWDNLQVLDTSTYADTDSGYVRGVQSPTYIAFNTGGQHATISLASGVFDVDGLYVIAESPIAIGVSFSGILNGTTLFNEYFSINDQNSIFADLNFIGIDSLVIRTYRNGANTGRGVFVGLDDFTYSVANVAQAPLPAALPLFGGGLGLMSLFGWWRRRKAAV